MIKPGVTFGALADFVNGFGADRGNEDSDAIARLRLRRRWAAVQRSERAPGVRAICR